MKKKFLMLIAIGVVFGAYVVLNMPVQGLENWCESKGGKWSDQSKFCSIGDNFSCTIIGGKYNSCDSRFVDETGNIVESPATMCRQTCQFT